MLQPWGFVLRPLVLQSFEVAIGCCGLRIVRICFHCVVILGSRIGVVCFRFADQFGQFWACWHAGVVWWLNANRGQQQWMCDEGNRCRGASIVAGVGVMWIVVLFQSGVDFLCCWGQYVWGVVSCGVQGRIRLFCFILFHFDDPRCS